MDIQAPSRWRSVDFLSDLHLHPHDEATVTAWRNYLQHTSADALFVLGDLFEVWVGDDVLDDAGSFESACADALRDASRHAEVFVMCGNRDFLMGERLMRACHATALPDPCVLVMADQRLVLSHGDALCLDDAEYQQFRTVVRGEAWQKEFLSKPLSERQAIARALRQQSENRKLDQTFYADADPVAAQSLMDKLDGNVLVHGHTHKAAEHTMADGKLRWVLSDWAADAQPARLQILRATVQGDQHLSLQRFTLTP